MDVVARSVAKRRLGPYPLELHEQWAELTRHAWVLKHQIHQIYACFLIDGKWSRLKTSRKSSTRGHARVGSEGGACVGANSIEAHRVRRGAAPVLGGQKADKSAKQSLNKRKEVSLKGMEEEKEALPVATMPLADALLPSRQSRSLQVPPRNMESTETSTGHHDSRDPDEALAIIGGVSVCERQQRLLSVY